MQIRQSGEPYERLLKLMEEHFCQAGQDPDGDQHYKEMPIVASGLRELRDLVSAGFGSEEEESAFSRQFWPAFNAWLLYYIELNRFASDKKYFDFLLRQKPEDVLRASKTKGWKFEWRKSRAAAVELIKAQALTESVYVNGLPATTVQLVAKWEEDYGMDLRDFNKSLYAMDARKTEPTPYLTELMNGLLGRKRMLRK